MSEIPMTVEGEAALREELNRLKTVDRPRIIQAIAEAREHGDLKENAEYHAAREQQSFAEGRIGEIEGKLAQSRVIDITTIPNKGKVIFGTTIVLVNVDTGEQVTYKIVGDDESDVKQNKISLNTPIARGLIGKEVGEVAKIVTPTSELEYEIGEVQHI